MINWIIRRLVTLEYRIRVWFFLRKIEEKFGVKLTTKEFKVVFDEMKK